MRAGSCATPVTSHSRWIGFVFQIVFHPLFLPPFTSPNFALTPISWNLRRRQPTLLSAASRTQPRASWTATMTRSSSCPRSRVKTKPHGSYHRRVPGERILAYSGQSCGLCAKPDKIVGYQRHPRALSPRVCVSVHTPRLLSWCMNGGCVGARG